MSKNQNNMQQKRTIKIVGASCLLLINIALIIFLIYSFIHTFTTSLDYAGGWGVIIYAAFLFIRILTPILAIPVITISVFMIIGLKKFTSKQITDIDKISKNTSYFDNVIIINIVILVVYLFFALKNVIFR